LKLGMFFMPLLCLAIVGLGDSMVIDKQQPGS
jgi:hypothetical protein